MATITYHRTAQFIGQQLSHALLSRLTRGTRVACNEVQRAVVCRQINPMMVQEIVWQTLRPNIHQGFRVKPARRRSVDNDAGLSCSPEVTDISFACHIPEQEATLSAHLGGLGPLHGAGIVRTEIDGRLVGSRWCAGRAEDLTGM